MANIKHAAVARSAPFSAIGARVEAVDWAQATADLDGQGAAVLKGLLSPEQCRALAALYPDDARFRSRIVMGRHGFGRGEYKYFSYPLPDPIAELRPALYARLCGVANRWNETMGIDIRYPDRHEAFLKRCHDAGQCGRRRCCCSMATAITIVCIRISTANMCSRCKSQSCYRSRGAISPAANSCSPAAAADAVAA